MLNWWGKVVNNITFEELICFSKVYSVLLGMTSPLSVSKYEKDLAYEAIKKMADNRYDWTHEQKELYKLLVDYVKKQSN